jgi:hypothetical protein
MKSGREYNSRNQKKHRKHVSLSEMSNSNDDSHLPPPNTKGQSCLVCRQKGHGIDRCPLSLASNLWRKTMNMFVKGSHGTCLALPNVNSTIDALGMIEQS